MLCKINGMNVMVQHFFRARDIFVQVYMCIWQYTYKYVYLSESYDKPVVMNTIRVGGGGSFSYVECGWLNKRVHTL